MVIEFFQTVAVAFAGSTRDGVLGNRISFEAVVISAVAVTAMVLVELLVELNEVAVWEAETEALAN